MADLESAGVGDLIRLKVPVRAAIETLRKSRCELQSDESQRRQFPPDMALATGVTPHRWLMARRVDRAKDLMRSTEAPLAEIALKCGFSEQSHFTRVFSQTTGTTPAQWRQESKARQMVIGRSVPPVPNRRSNDC
jgi:methylphosphotriester-DNA--protein-cysteine methyltransferase